MRDLYSLIAEMSWNFQRKYQWKYPWNFRASKISRNLTSLYCFGDLTRDRQTVDNKQTDGRQTTDAATETEGSHAKCASLITDCYIAKVSRQSPRLRLDNYVCGRLKGRQRHVPSRDVVSTRESEWRTQCCRVGAQCSRRLNAAASPAAAAAAAESIHTAGYSTRTPRSDATESE